MAFYPVFLSVVFAVLNQSTHLEKILSEAAIEISSLVSDYELIIIDNASGDDSVSVLKNLTGENGQPNLQVYALTKEVDADTASWVGAENALGDFVAVLDPLADDIGFLPAHSAIRMQLDTGALTLNGEDPATVLQHCSSLIGHVHVSEPHLLPLGDGATDHAKVAEALRRHLPDQVISIEMLATQNEPHPVSIERALTVAVRHYRNRS